MNDLIEPYHNEKTSGGVSTEFSLKRRTAAGYIKKVVNYIYLPAFSVANSWLGASHIVAKYNYVISEKFTFLALPERPNDSFVLCVTFGGQRYKLWSDIGEILYFPLFTSGILINTSFSFEIWNTLGQSPAINPGPLVINISSLSVPLLFNLNCDELIGADKTSYTATCDNFMTLTGFNPSTEQFSFVNNPCAGEQIPL